MSRLEAEFELMLTEEKAPPWVREHEFDAGGRRWRLDFAWPEFKVAAELQGGTRGIRGRHVRAGGYAGDCEKLNAAQVQGWIVLWFTSASFNAVKTVMDTLRIRGWRES